MANTIKIKRGSGSDPSASDMVLGEPVLRTDTAELFFKKDDGSVAKVSGGGGGPDFKYLELRNAANNGAASYPANDFTLVTSGTTNAITPVAANTLLVSVNGIIQKPNAGTSTSGITGFIVDGSRFKTAANLSAAPDFILYQESGGIGEPSDNTVTSAKIVDGSIVNADINASAGIAGTKISPDFGSQNTTTTGIAAVGELQITSTAPKILFIDSDTDPDYELRNMNGVFRLRDSTNDIIRITQTGSITDIAGHVDVGAGLDVTGAITASTSITATGNLTTNGNFTISGTNPNIFLTDTNNDSDFRISNSNGILEFRDLTNTSTRLQIDSSGNVQIPNDSVFLQIGAGQDLDLHHNGTNSYIRNKTGDLHIRPLVSEEGIILKPNGAVELYHDNVRKLRTTSGGITFEATDAGGSEHFGRLYFKQESGTVRGLFDPAAQKFSVYDNSQFTVGNDSDAKFFHDGSNTTLINTTGNLLIKNDGTSTTEEILIQAKGGENSIRAIADGAVELYFNNSRKLRTKTAGIEIEGELGMADNYKIKLGTGEDLEIYHDGTNSFIKDTAGAAFNILATESIAIKTNNTEFAIACNKNGSVELYHDNSKKFETSSTGATVTGTLAATNTHITTQMFMPDNGQIRLGNSDDLKIYHDGLNSYIRENGTGSLYIDSNGNGVVLRGIQGEDSIVCNANGDVELYYDNTKKLETKSFGASISGSLEVTAHVYAPDNGKLLLGNAQDFEFFHDGAVSLIRSSSHPIGYYSNTRHHFLNANGSENIAVFTTNGACELYHDGTKRIETTTTGAAVNGAFYIGPPAGTDRDLVINKEGTGTLVRFRTTGTTRGTITSNGSTVAYNTSASDRSMKKNFEDWTEDTLALFKNINPQKFNFLDQEDGIEKDKGFIAQDLVASFPEAYPKIDEKYMFNPSAMVVYLMKAVQELTAKVEALENK